MPTAQSANKLKFLNYTHILTKQKHLKFNEKLQ